MVGFCSRHYANSFEAPEALDLSGPLSRLGFQDPVYVIRAKSLQLNILKPSDGFKGHGRRMGWLVCFEAFLLSGWI